MPMEICFVTFRTGYCGFVGVLSNIQMNAKALAGLVYGALLEKQNITKLQRYHTQPLSM